MSTPVGIVRLSGRVVSIRRMGNKDGQVGLRCSAEQKQLWERAAAIDRRSLTDWIRIKLDDAATADIQRAEKKRRT